MNKNSIAPWEDHNDSRSFIFQPQRTPSYQQNIVEIENNQPLRHFRSSSLTKYEKRFLEVQPRVYDKKASTIDLGPIRKAQQKLIKVQAKIPKNNELTISIPTPSIYVNRIHKELPKHLVQRINKTPSFNPDPEPKIQRYNDEQMQLLRKRLRKNSQQLQNQQLQNMRKANLYEQQLIKKCSLKTLHVYDQNDLMKLKTNKPLKLQRIQKSGAIKEKPHILDRILSRFQ